MQLVHNVKNYKVPLTQGKEMKYDRRSGMKLMCLARSSELTKTRLYSLPSLLDTARHC